MPPNYGCVAQLAEAIVSKTIQVWIRIPPQLPKIRGVMKVKYWRYNELIDGETLRDIPVIRSDQEILNSSGFWDFYVREMERAGKQNDISEESCIESWVKIYQASEVTEEEYKLYKSGIVF